MKKLNGCFVFILMALSALTQLQAALTQLQAALTQLQAALTQLQAALTQLQAAQAQRPEVSLELGAKSEENGIRLERKAVEIGTGDADGKTAWVSRHKSVAADQWARSFLLTISDPRFKNGKMPDVSVEIRYLHGANTAVEVKADTASGSEKVASAWGNDPKWQTLKFKMTNAFFGARP